MIMEQWWVMWRNVIANWIGEVWLMYAKAKGMLCQELLLSSITNLLLLWVLVGTRRIHLSKRFIMTIRNILRQMLVVVIAMIGVVINWWLKLWCALMNCRSAVYIGMRLGWLLAVGDVFGAILVQIVTIPLQTFKQMVY